LERIKDMAKIKSTLDLVMEKTKNMAVSPSDREALHRKELQDKAMGWVRMVMDRKMTIPELMRTYSDEVSRYSSLSDILRTGLLGAIDPDADNGPVLQALAEVLKCDVTPIEGSIREYRTCLEEHRQRHQNRLRGVFKDKGIAGTAVVPNLNSDETWSAFAKDFREQFTRKLLAS